MPEFEAMTIDHAGTRLQGFLAHPEGAARGPAVLMFPGATGPGATFCATARELAGLGYLAVGVDMYGADADIATPQAAGVHFAALLEAPDRLRARVVAWFEAVAARGDVDPARVAAIGYCFGGKCVLELARSGADVKAAVAYHGLLTTHAPARPGAVKAQVAVWSGGRDPYAPVAELDALRAELDAAGASYQATLFSYAQHSFTDPDHDTIGLEGIAYHPLAHRVSWAGTLCLLEQTIGSCPGRAPNRP
ncbi:dienelactone hydrolase family protein [Novosphingobium album (ex Liu et al. 2023)]|uniref:Dienelactone hydrolase family protein n=1 Tax=Novosphingobium album (ex Liu et al. 2023) TaxID=3031130 RepID=A0ABT5WRQ1_9SPHN|nr:dienelactone hydrolase family protein [Novosphingobium album (ex Liu et al. 2023)]MDE8652711.1 dienelactone hydrolase family protein [Novosphingobium album (ex Liu et al. 2023)]